MAYHPMEYPYSAILMEDALYLYKQVDGVNYYTNTIAKGGPLLNIQVSVCGTYLSYIEVADPMLRLVVYHLNTATKELNQVFYKEIEAEPGTEYSIVYNHSGTAVAFQVVWYEVVVVDLVKGTHEDYALKERQHLPNYNQLLLPVSDNNFIWTGYDNHIRLIRFREQGMSTVACI